MSLHCPIRLWITEAVLAASVLPAARPAPAQYPGQVTSANKNTPTLRAIAVLEWTGDQDHPKASRIVPVCVYDGQELQDGGIYLARPAPLALESEVEYQIQQNGRPVGLFDIENAAREQGAWVGYGKLKPLPRPKPAPVQMAKIDEYDDAQSNVPILHRGGDAARRNSENTGSNSKAPAPDPDRPTLHRSPDASSASSGSSRSVSNSDRPKLEKTKKEDGGYVSDVATLTDPNRPHLFRGKSAGYSAPVLPSLIGLPPEMHQEVAVSDAESRPLHVWDYIWANPDDENKMKAGMEDMARAALGLNPPPAPAAKAKPAHKTASSPKTAEAAIPLAPAPLLDEQFRVFELAYGSGATMVLSAHTAGAGEPMKFVTLIAQPDLYGNLAVLVKNVTDAAHLDDTPRMRLVDAVDALADNRGELLFELRGATQRQFALYRVLRGQATRLFVSGPNAINTTGAAPTSE